VQYKGHWTPLGSEKAWERYARRANDMLPAVGLCRQLRTVIQAGGNIGAWPVWLAANFVDVMTFEPEKTNYQCLVRNTEAHHNITPYHAALSDAVGTVNLKVCKSIGSHHLIPGEGSIQALTIDGFGLNTVDLIVLDVEGAEWHALKGGLETIKRCRPIIQIEDRGHGTKKGFGTTFDDIVELLDGYGVHQRIGRDVIFKPWGTP
jgi:FkbM family methyltransferase